MVLPSSARPEHEGRVGAARRPRRRPGARLPGQAVGPGGGSAERRRHLLEPEWRELLHPG